LGQTLRLGRPETCATDGDGRHGFERSHLWLCTKPPGRPVCSCIGRLLERVSVKQVLLGFPGPVGLTWQKAISECCRPQWANW
jgi:hypothetical protein